MDQMDCRSSESSGVAMRYAARYAYYVCQAHKLHRLVKALLKISIAGLALSRWLDRQEVAGKEPR